MPTTKRFAAPATGADEASSDTQVAQQLSALLKKSQAARTAALFRADCPVSQHIIREAERAALDPNMMLAVYLGVVAQVLNPCAHARYRIVPPLPCSSPPRPMLSHPSHSPRASQVRHATGRTGR